MSNPYSEFTIDDFKNKDLIDEAMSNCAIGKSGRFRILGVWAESQEYKDMQSRFMDERLQELACCNCGNERCGVDGICEKGAELEEKVKQLYKDLDL